MSRVMGSGDGITAVARAPGLRRDWVVAGSAFGVLVAAILALYWPTAAAMVEIWSRSETYAHGYVIVPLSLYMLWTRREHLAGLRPRPAWWPLPLFALTVLGWLLGFLVDVAVVAQLGLVALIVLAAVAAFGTRVGWAMSFPLAYLFFAVPMGGDLEPLLMDFTAVFTVDLLRLTGIPVFVEGRYLTLPTGNWEVAQACSGIRYLMASLALGTLYAYLTYSRVWKRAVFILLSILAPILANGLRAYGIVMIGHLSGMKLATGVDHIIYGWVFFGVVMLLLFWLGSFFRDDEPAPRGADAGAPDPGQGEPAHWGRYAGVLGALVLVAALGPALAWSATQQSQSARGTEVAFPPAEGAWSGPSAPGQPLEPFFVGAPLIEQAEYVRGGAAVTVVLVHYGPGVEGELVTYGNRFYDGEDWLRLDESSRPLPEGAGVSKAKEVVLRHHGRQYVLWWWYDINGTPAVNRYAAKLLEAWGVLTGSDAGGSLVAVATPAAAGRDEARGLLREFLLAPPVGLEPERLLRHAQAP